MEWSDRNQLWGAHSEQQEGMGHAIVGKGKRKALPQFRSQSLHQQAERCWPACRTDCRRERIQGRHPTLRSGRF